MSKNKTMFACTACGNESAKWTGKCFACGEWNTMVERQIALTGKAAEGAKTIIRDGNRQPKFLHEVKKEQFPGISSGMSEVDRVLGGKIINGMLVLIGGEPGKGKSTLLLQIAANIADSGKKVIYFSGEESEYQTRLRAERLQIKSTNIMVLHTKDIEAIEEIAESEKPDLIIVDSIQTLGDPTIKSEPGSPSQVKNCTGRLVNIAKGKNISIFVVGQVNKNTDIAGPKILEHMVDTVLYLEGEKYNDLRLLRANKNRFGSINELGVFQMEQEGLIEIKNPSEYLLSNRVKNANGSVVTCVSDTRPLLIEIQGLVTPPVVQNAIPRRTSEGFSRNRLSIIVAVLEKICKLPLSYKDIYLNVVGGMEIEEPTADLAIAMALYSSEKSIPVEKNDRDRYVIMGEIGLTGEVRPVAHIEQLVSESEKVGFTHAVLPTKNYEMIKKKFKKINLIPVDTVNQAVAVLFQPSNSK